MFACPSLRSVVRPLSTLLTLPLILFAFSWVRGQDPNPSPTPDANTAELQKLKDQLELLKQISTLQKDVAQAQADRATQERNRILNALPQPTLTPLAGSATITNFTLENEILAYRALGTVTRKIAEGFSVPSKSNLIIYNESDVRAMETYLVLLGQMRGYNEAYRNRLPRVEVGVESALLGPQVASTFLRSVVDLLALFRTDVKIEGLTISLDDEAVGSRLSHELAGKFTVYNSKLLLPNTIGADELKSAALQELYALQHFRALADTVTLTDQSTKEQLTALNKEVDKFLVALLQVDEQTKRNPLAGLFRAEKILSLLPAKGGNEPPLYILYLKVVKAGGSHTTKTNLFKGTRVMETGGIIVAYTLINTNGSSNSSGVCYAYLAWKNLSNEPSELLANCN